MACRLMGTRPLSKQMLICQWDPSRKKWILNQIQFFWSQYIDCSSFIRHLWQSTKHIKWDLHVSKNNMEELTFIIIAVKNSTCHDIPYIHLLSLVHIIWGFFVRSNHHGSRWYIISYRILWNQLIIHALVICNGVYTEGKDGQNTRIKLCITLRQCQNQQKNTGPAYKLLLSFTVI